MLPHLPLCLSSASKQYYRGGGFFGWLVFLLHSLLHIPVRLLILFVHIVFMLTLRGVLFVYLRYPNLAKSGAGNQE